jgi:tRNA(adenine34) deaminase
MWDELIEPWQICLTLSWEALLEGSRPIGAVIVDAEGRIIAQGRNRASGLIESQEKQIVGGPLAHAEINALLALDLLNTDVHSVELFTTVEPCPLCIGAICMIGVKKVRFAARDSWSGSTNLLDASPYLRWKQITAIPPQNDELESIVHMLQVCDQLTLNHPRTEDVLNKWSAHYPENVRKGRRLFISGELVRLKEDSIPAKDAMNHLFELARTLD